MKITWHNEKRFIRNLVFWSKNPRLLTEQQGEQLGVSLDKFGYVDIVVINIDNVVIGGHQRLGKLIEKHGHDYEIDVRVPDRMLSESEFEELALRLNRNTGSWDYAKLETTFNIAQLLDFGFEKWEFGIQNGELPALQTMDSIVTDERKKVEFLASKENRRVVFEVLMQGADRDRLHKVLNAVKQQFALETTESALMKMADIVQSMVELGVPADEIARRLGMEDEEVVRLANRNGIPISMLGKEFGQSWRPKE